MPKLKRNLRTRDVNSDRECHAWVDAAQGAMRNEACLAELNTFSFPYPMQLLIYQSPPLSLCLTFATVTPPTSSSCSLSSPQLDECIRGLFASIVPRLKSQGLPEYGMGSIDPYFYQRGIFRYSNDGIQGGLLIKNMEIYGISSLKVNSVASNFTKSGFVIKLGVELPQLKAGGQFKADVKFGGLRLVPKGPFNITIGG